MSAVDPITTAFTALETRLRSVFTAARWDFNIVADPMSIDEFRAIVRRTPLLALAWRRFNPVEKAGRRFQGILDLRLTIVVKHPHDAARRFLGDARGPGLFPSIAAAIALINGYTVPDLGTFSVSAVAQAFAEGYGDTNIAIATLDIASHLVIGDVTGALADAPEFLSQLSSFVPWPDGQDPDAAIDMRQT